MKRLHSQENAEMQFLSFPEELIILIVSFLGTSGRFTFLTVSSYFSDLLRDLWHNPAFFSHGLWTDRYVLHSHRLCCPRHAPVVSREYIYLVSPHMNGSFENRLAIVTLDSGTVMPVADLRLSADNYLKPVVSNSLVFFTAQHDEDGALCILRRLENGTHEMMQEGIWIEFSPGQPLSRGQILYVPGNFLNVYSPNEGLQYALDDQVDLESLEVKYMVVLNEHDILLVGKFGRLAVVRRYENGRHSIVQNIYLPISDPHYSPVVDGNFIYVPFHGPNDLFGDFYVIHRDQNGVYERWEAFYIGFPTSPAIMGSDIVVASHTSGTVFVFRRDEKDHHHIVQTIWLENACPNFLVPHNNALYISNAESHRITILYRQIDGRFREVGKLRDPGGCPDDRENCQPVLHGDVLLLGSGSTLTTVSYPCLVMPAQADINEVETAKGPNLEKK